MRQRFEISLGYRENPDHVVWLFHTSYSVAAISTVHLSPLEILLDVIGSVC